VASELESDWRAGAPPAALLDEIDSAPVVGIAEEHVAQGGFGQQFLHFLALSGRSARMAVHACALGYPSGRYGSQRWHREECGLDAAAILGLMRERAGA
jgi:transketolase